MYALQPVTKLMQPAGNNVNDFLRPLLLCRVHNVFLYSFMYLSTGDANSVKLPIIKDIISFVKFKMQLKILYFQRKIKNMQSVKLKVCALYIIQSQYLYRY